MKRMATLFAILGVVALLAAPASAVTLWDQSDYDEGAPGFFNSESGGPPFGMTWYTLCDITVDNVWMVTEIVQWYGAVDPNFAAGIFQGTLNIIPKTGPMPGPADDPTTGIVVPMTGTLEAGQFGDVIRVTASGLSIQMNPGEYWVGITPAASTGPFGPEPQLACMTQIGDASASYDAFGFPAPMWFDFNGGVDACIQVNGDITVPNESASFGQVKALFSN